MDIQFRFFQSLALSLVGILLFAQTVNSDSRPIILVIGDSISAGYGVDLEDAWITLLQTRLEEKGYVHRIVNASISGDTTGNGLRRLPRALDIHQPEILIIALGGNDGLRGLPIETIRDNLAQMITLGRESGARVVVAGMLMPPNYGDDYTSEYADIYPAVAKEYNTALIPFFMDGVALEPELMQDDGIHPNTAAQPILMDNVWATLEPMLIKQTSANATRSYH